MSVDKTPAENLAESVKNAMQSTLDGNSGLLSQFSDMAAHPVKMQQALWKEAMEIMAQSAQSYADYLGKLALAQDPMTILAVHNDYLSKVAARSASHSTALGAMARTVAEAQTKPTTR